MQTPWALGAKSVLPAAVMAAIALIAAPAFAVPALGEVYVGGGIRSFGGTPGLSDEGKHINYGGTFEAGIDNSAIIRQLGVGVRGDWSGGPGRWSAEARYTALTLPAFRALVGGAIGFDDKGLDGRFGGFVAVRVVLGLPYLGAQIGLYRESGTGDVSSGSQLTVGVAF